MAIFVLLLANMLALAFKVQPVNAAGTIYIRADGSIDPPTAPISTVDNVTYTLTDNINDSIVVERDNIVVDGVGYTIQGMGSGNGISLSGRSNVAIKNMTIKAFSYGIYLYYSSNNSISGNNITTNNEDGIDLDSSSNHNSISGNNITTNNNYGIYLYPSSNNSITGNNITNNGNGIHLYDSSNNAISGNTFTNNGLSVWGNQNSVENNTVNGKPLVYLEGVSEHTVDDAGQVILIRCESITVAGLSLFKTDFGIELWETSNSTITGNNITNNNYGILLGSSSNNEISGNNITTNKSYGIWLYYSSNNSISGNNIATNNDYGVLLDSSSSNRIFHNSFVNNNIQIYSTNSAGIWDDGYPSGGNYWSDYVGSDTYSGPYQNETGSDGIGDTSYIIDANNIDHYPLMSEYIIPEFPSFIVLPLFFLATLLAVITYRRKHR